jgi:hypothetical protein
MAKKYLGVDERFFAPLGIGVVVVVIFIAGVFFLQRGSHIELKGAILKVRTQAMDENSSVAVLDFRFVNPSNYPFVVRTVDVTIDDKAGKTYQGQTISEVDARRMFEYYKILGQKYNDSLLMRDKIGPRQSQDRMIAALFQMPVEKLEARKQIKIRIEDVDGPVSELVGK